MYRSDHAAVLARHREWFTRMTEDFKVLWWVPVGHRPTPSEAVARLDQLHQHGPSAFAFTFKQPFPPPDVT